MLVKILKSFPCAIDAGGVAFRLMEAGAVEDVRDDLAPGLIAERFVAPVEPAAAAAHPADEPVGPAEAEPAPVGPGPAAAEAGEPITGDGSGEALAPFLKAVHRGGGSYSVMRDDEEVVERLKKDEAAAFNALDAEAQAAFIAKRGA